MSLERYLPQNRTNTIVFIFSVILTALVWGVGYAKFTMQPEEGYTQLLMVTCTIGLCSGGVVAFIPNLWLALGFNICIMLPGTISQLAFTDKPSLGILFALFFIYVIFMAYRQNNEYWTALNNEYLLEQKTKALENLSNRDGLTGIYNRRYFNKAFSFEWKRAARNKTSLVVLICDVDYFKIVNDQYGHLAGDEYLKMLTKLLDSVFKRETDVVARYGGEEFVVLMPEEEIETVMNQAELFRQTVELNPLEFKNQIICGTVSIGVSEMTPEPGMDKDNLLSQADKALYAAKTKGRNQVCL